MRITALFAACLSVPLFLSWMASPDVGDPGDRCAGVSAFQTSGVKDTVATLTWSASSNATSTDLRWRETGSPDWNEVTGAESPFVLDALTPCMSYEAQVRAQCTDVPGDYSGSVTFEADGCCRIPSGFKAVSVQSESFTLSWDSVDFAFNFHLRYRQMGTMDWDTIEVTSVETVISALTACTAYEVQINAECDLTITEFSESLIVRTIGCGTCTAGNYCPTMAFDASYEWIDSVSMAGIRARTGSDGGYASFATERANLERGRTYSFYAQPGFSGEMCPQYFRVWIDLDQDAMFNDTTELFLDAIDDTGSGLSADIALPGNTPLGVTRMRIAMVPVGEQDTITPDPCGIYDFGEVEDYCIRIGDVCPFPVVFDTLSTTETTATIGWSGTDKAIGYLYQYMEVGSNDFESDVTMDTVLVLEELDECTDYIFTLVTICVQDTQVTTLEFRTRCETSTVTLPDFLNDMHVYPNPFRDHLTVELEASRNLDGRLELIDMVGRMMYAESMSLLSGSRQVQQLSEVADLPAGMYYVLFRSGGQVAVRKVVKGGE